MLAITGGMNIWFIANVNDMRIGRRRLLEIVKDRFPNPYNGDLFAFMSKNRRLLKMVRYENHMYMLYELESLAQTPLSEMERQDYISQINSLKETTEEFKEMNVVLKQAFTSSEQGRERAQMQIEALQGVISNLSKEIALLRKEVSRQTDYNKRHDKMSFGKKSLSSSVRQEAKRSREESKMDYDGSGKGANSASDKSEAGTSENSSTTADSSSLDRAKVKSENLDKERGPRGPYSQMEAARGSV